MIEFANARKKLMEKLEDKSIAIIPAARLQFRNANTEYLFRQNSNFYYLTGYCEPDAIGVLIKEKNNNKFILFVPPKIKEQETWTGVRVGQDNAISIYKADEAYTLEQTEVTIPQLLKNKKMIYFPMEEDFTFHQKLLSWLKLVKTKVIKEARNKGEKIKYIPSALYDLSPLIAELRILKSNLELEMIRKAADISCKAHLEIMQHCKPDLYEYQLGSIFIERSMALGCQSLAYPIIVASGASSCILHYVENNKKIENGELVVVDAGGEYKYYASDITRTIPVNGKFNDAQKAIYNIVLDAQLAGIEVIKPGNSFAMVQQSVVRVLVQGLVAIGILQGELDNLIQEKAYKKFYMHNASHWLGLDVHDVGDYYKQGEHCTFSPGMVLTVEPGLYISKELGAEVDKKWHDIGVRIEDMVLVTSMGSEVLTKDLPKTVKEIENAMHLYD